MIAGSVTVDPTTGAVTGSGLALQLFEAEIQGVDAFRALLPLYRPDFDWSAPIPPEVERVQKAFVAAKSNRLAAVLVARFGVVPVPKESLDPGIPSDDRELVLP